MLISEGVSDELTLGAGVGAAPLLFGPLTTHIGICEVPAGGLSPVEALALFATLWASVPMSLQE